MRYPLKHRFVETNGIRMHIAEQGEGPLVILCHGFFGCWYTWQQQLAALAEAGFRAVAPDQRGYGQTDCPRPVESYAISDLVSDIVGLIYALDQNQCTMVGHDWGAPVAWNCALLRPDLIHSLCLLSIPYLQGFYDAPPPVQAMAQASGEDYQIYQVYFQEPGKADAELNRDVRASLLGYFYGASATPPPDKRWRFIFPRSMRFIDTIPAPAALPPWLCEEDLDAFTREYQTSGFQGGLNWYRNLDYDRQLLAFLKQAKIEQPSLFIAGEADAMITMYKQDVDRLEESMPGLRDKIVLPDVGHWVSQEKPDVLNGHLTRFLSSLQSGIAGGSGIG